MIVVEDSDLRQAVIDEFACDPMIADEPIGVAVENGVVTITGKVDTYAKKLAAEQAAQRVRGVEAVAEEIVVDIPSICERTDKDVAEAALYALAWDATVPHEKIMIKVENGWITLSGHVDWGFQKTAAEKAIRNLSGVRGVYNLIWAKPQADPTSVKKEISRLFHKNIQRDLDHIRIETKDGIVQLRGSVSSWTEKQEATKAAWNTPGVSKVENYITISA
jgi:osmotically-inducible protein OsmY